MPVSLPVDVSKKVRGVSSLLLLATCTMCQQQEVAPAPNATFVFRGTADPVLTLGTSDTCTVASLAQTSQTVRWDLGNGTQATTPHVVLSYPVAGIYTVKLTATNQAGETQTEVKTVRVLNRVLKRIVFHRVYWSLAPGSIPNFNATWPRTMTADVYAQIQEVAATTTFPPGGLVPSAPILFTSAALPAVSYDTQTPLTLNVATRVIFDKQKFKAGGYLLSMLARNAEGTYCLFSNMFSGSNALITKESIARNEFSVTTSLISSLTFECEYE
jgi:PKD repeat protein